MMLEGAGFKVVDLGVDLTVEKLIEQIDVGGDRVTVDGSRFGSIGWCDPAANPDGHPDGVSVGTLPVKSDLLITGWAHVHGQGVVVHVLKLGDLRTKRKHGGKLLRQTFRLYRRVDLRGNRLGNSYWDTIGH